MIKEKKNIQSLLFALIALLALNWLGSKFYHRFDLTQDKRYTLSEAAKATLEQANSPINIEVFLEGNLPPEFKRLKNETQQLLEEFRAANSNVIYQFVDPQSSEETLRSVQTQLQQLNLRGALVQIQEGGKTTNETIYPWAIAYHNEKVVSIGLLKKIQGKTPEERVNASIQNLEYAFADGFGKLTRPKRRKVAVLKGNAEMDDRYIADFITTLRDYYYIGQFTLDSVAVSPQRTLESIQGYDLLIVAQPQQSFSEEEKYVLDQYVMHGGSSLWMIDATTQRLDTVSGNSFAFGIDLGLNDFFFKYGVRINPNLVKSLPPSYVVLATGEERDSEYTPFPWLFSPLVAPETSHPIVNNIDPVKFEYVSSLDTLPNAIDKTLLLSTGIESKIIGLPAEIDLDREIPKNVEIMLQKENNRPDFNAGPVPVAVLLEGEFQSVYANRVKPFALENARESSQVSKMVVISDGDVIKNQLDRGRPLELGYDKWTNKFHGNKEFLLNTVNYLLDDSGLINIRSKEIAVAFLDLDKTSEKRGLWQFVNLVVPLVLLLLFGIVFSYLRKRKYAR